MNILIAIFLSTGLRYHWVENEAIPTWYISFAVSNYTIVSDSFVYGDSTMPIYHYMVPSEAGNAGTAFSNVPDMLTFYSDIFGARYPFFHEKYGFVRLPSLWWAMEMQTNVFFAIPIPASHSREIIIAHETAHQWWGCSITPGSIKDVWLNEGFAVYCEALYSDHWADGASYHDYMVSQIMNYYLSHENDPFGHPYPMYDPPDGAVWTATTYEKGASVLHMLRHIIGDSTFFNILRTYYQTNKYGNAVTSEFQAIAETVFGKDLDWFFTEWIYKAGHPEYECSWGWDSLGPDSFKVSLLVNQVQSHDFDVPTFKMPIDIEIEDGDTSQFVIWDSLDAQNFEFMVTHHPTALAFDPGDWVLKEVSIKGLHKPVQKAVATTTSWVPDRDIFHKPFPASSIRYPVSSFDSTYPYDVLHYNIQIELDFPGDSILSAWTEITTCVVDTLSHAKFNFVGLVIDSVLVDGDSSGYERIGSGVDEMLSVDLGGTLSAGDTFVVAVRYYGRPEEGIYYNTFNGGLSYVMSIPWPGTDLPVGARYWFPCCDAFNDKATSELWVTVPEGYKVVANGRLESVDTLGIEEKPELLTKKLSLEVYPNPFTAGVRVQWSGISEKEKISLQIYDLSGRLVKTLITNHSPLTTTVTWDAHRMPAGIYFVKLKAGTHALTKKLILMRR